MTDHLHVETQAEDVRHPEGGGQTEFVTHERNADILRIVASLKTAKTIYSHFVRAQTRLANHISAVKRNATNPASAELVCVQLAASLKVLDRPRREQAREIEALAKQLPVAAWVRSVRGAGMLNLGLIIGEAGAGRPVAVEP